MGTIRLGIIGVGNCASSLLQGILNMLNRERLDFKKISKTEAVQSVLSQPLPADNVHIGPSDYVPWQKDNKVCFLRIEGRGFGGARIELELRLSVEDSPNSAGVAIDAIRCCKLARDRGIGGPLIGVSAYLMKHPPKQICDDVARDLVERFIREAGPESNRSAIAASWGGRRSPRRRSFETREPATTS